MVKTQGIPAQKLLQIIASGAMGPSAFQRGKKSAAAGVFFHFLIAFAVASIYYGLSRKLTALIDYPLFSSVIYGSAVHLVMSCLVVPLSAAPKRDFSAKAFVTQLILHVVCVALPIALVVRHFST